MKRRVAILGSDSAAERAWALCPGVDSGPPDSAEIVHLSVPLPERENLAEKLTAEGRDVLCRPPIASSPESIARIASVAAGSDARLRPFYPARFNPRYREIRSCVAQGHVGEPCILRLEWLFCREDGVAFHGSAVGGGRSRR